MAKIKKFTTKEIEINASIDKVWDIAYTRFGETYLFNPNISGSHFSNGNEGKVGCERECQIDAKTHIKERIVSATEKKKFALDVVGGNMPMVETLNVEFNFLPIGENKMKIHIVGKFSTKPSFMASLMKAPFRSKLTDILIGLKYYAETGKSLSKDTYKPIARQYKRLQPSQSFQVA
jgi:hypothetical protein